MAARICLLPTKKGEQDLADLIKSMGGIFGIINSRGFYRLESKDIRAFRICLELYQSLPNDHWIKRKYPNPEEVEEWHDVIVRYYKEKHDRWE